MMSCKQIVFAPFYIAKFEIVTAENYNAAKWLKNQCPILSHTIGGARVLLARIHRLNEFFVGRKRRLFGSVALVILL